MGIRACYNNIGNVCPSSTSSHTSQTLLSFSRNSTVPRQNVVLKASSYNPISRPPRPNRKIHSRHHKMVHHQPRHAIRILHLRRQSRGNTTFPDIRISKDKPPRERKGTLSPSPRFPCLSSS